MDVRGLRTRERSRQANLHLGRAPIKYGWRHGIMMGWEERTQKGYLYTFLLSLRSTLWSWQLFIKFILSDCNACACARLRKRALKHECVLHDDETETDCEFGQFVWWAEQSFGTGSLTIRGSLKLCVLQVADVIRVWIFGAGSVKSNLTVFFFRYLT